MQAVQTAQSETSAAFDAIAALIENVASAVLAADANDLSALASAHSCFQQIASTAATGLDAASRARFELPATEAGKMIEQLILGEMAEPEAGLRSVSDVTQQLQLMIREVSAAVTPKASPHISPDSSGTAAAASKSMPVNGLAEAEGAITPDDVPLALEFISEANTHIEAAEVNLLKLEEAPGDPEAVNSIFRSFHTVKGVAGFLNLKQIGALAHAAENLLDLARKGKLDIAGGIVDVVLESIDLLKALLTLLDTAVKTQQPIGAEPRLPDLIRRLHAAAEGKLYAAAPAVESAEASSAATNEPAKAAPAAGKHGDSAQGDGTIKVSTERLDSLINMVGELVISQSMVSQDVTVAAAGDHRMLRNLAHLGKITRELQDLSMSMRMVPIHGVFQKMARVVRDIGRKAGKEVDFAVVGGETELDRNVVEAIGDPLVHMVRNSVDHGIETPAQRIAAGKPAAGRLELRARHQAGQIIIEIADDGRGLNTERILKKAIDAGLVKPNEQLTDQQIFQLIFAAGLSTAEKITDISGRGVGMDVVRKNVEALRGRIDIQSVAGKGTTFSILLPLTLAVIDGMVVRVGSQRYIVPITSVERSIRPTPEQLSTVQGRGELCMVRDRLLPLLRLHRVFNVTPRTENPAESLVVIVHDNQRQCCLLVDELLGQQQVVIKSLGESIGPVRGVSGGAILGDGSVSVILDVPTLMDIA